jgi:hypothetical protein
VLEHRLNSGRKRAHNRAWSRSAPCCNDRRGNAWARPCAQALASLVEPQDNPGDLAALGEWTPGPPLSPLGIGHGIEGHRGCEHLVPFIAICQRPWRSQQTTSTAAVHVHTVCWQRGGTAHDTTATRRRHGKNAQSCAQNLQHLYTIFTAPLRLLSWPLSYSTASRPRTPDPPSR